MIRQIGNRTFSGNEIDLPINLPSGSIFISEDTTNIYIYDINMNPVLSNNKVHGLPMDFYLSTNSDSNTLLYKTDTYREITIPSGSIEITNINEVLRNGNDLFLTCNFYGDSAIVSLLDCKIINNVLVYSDIKHSDIININYIHGSVLYNGYIYASNREVVSEPVKIIKINPYDLEDQKVLQLPNQSEYIGTTDSIKAFGNHIYTYICTGSTTNASLVKIGIELDTYEVIYQIGAVAGRRVASPYPFVIFNGEIYVPWINRNGGVYDKMGIVVVDLNGNIIRETGEITLNANGQSRVLPHWMTYFNGKIIGTTIYNRSLYRIDATTMVLEDSIGLDESITDDNVIMKNGYIYLNGEYNSGDADNPPVNLLKVKYNNFTDFNIEILNYLNGKGAHGCIMYEETGDGNYVPEIQTPSISLQDVIDYGYTYSNLSSSIVFEPSSSVDGSDLSVKYYMGGQYSTAISEFRCDYQFNRWWNYSNSNQDNGAGISISNYANISLSNYNLAGNGGDISLTLSGLNINTYLSSGAYTDFNISNSGEFTVTVDDTVNSSELNLDTNLGLGFMSSGSSYVYLKTSNITLQRNIEFPDESGTISTQEWVNNNFNKFKDITFNIKMINKEWDVNTYSLIIGEEYIIDSLQAGDDFSNVGYVSDGVSFIATGTTPTNWTNGTYISNKIFLVNEYTNGTESVVSYNLDYGDNSYPLSINITNNLFIEDKLWIIHSSSGVYNIVSNNILKVSNIGQDYYYNDVLQNTSLYTSIEVRIYP